MPWKKNFDLDEATSKATEVFWAKGYEATSITDLVNAMEVNKGSLYNAFGSKKDLFIRSLLQYDRLYRQRLLTEMGAIDDPKAAIMALFDRMIEESEADSQRKGCLLVNTALDLPNHDPDVQKMVKAALLEFEQFFETCVKRGHQQGTISQMVDAQVAAKSLLALVVGLRVLARGVFDRSCLTAIRDQAMKIIAD
ncbi:TetR family transcriptional regulator [Maritalea mobilis]|uniref:TetR family transcriptional regulator n=1 Tax=Maritalea mobilis TaxID=483324 RepID=A0A4V3DAT1_9HYPH|nr:TetR/AcrR family transcriptional regulator [Maritalea mobilis]TDQ63674.1 TetR family transcriptional regulator [Maritalea mobilis]